MCVRISVYSQAKLISTKYWLFSAQYFTFKPLKFTVNYTLESEGTLFHLQYLDSIKRTDLSLQHGEIRSLHGPPICGESLDLAPLWMKTLPNRSIMFWFILFKTTDLAIGEL